MRADATGKLKSRDFEVTGTLSANVPKAFPALLGNRYRGAMTMPWTLSVIGGRELDLEGSLKLDSFAIGGRDWGVSGISGAIPVSEKLALDQGRLRFTRLITRNPFERVDFERVRPLLDDAVPFKVDSIHWQEKSYGPLIAFLSLEQNMLLAQQANLTLGRGRVYGEFFLDAYPAHLQVGVLSRITSLDLGEVLPQEYLKRVPSGDRAVSARTGVVVDLNRRTLSGRVDVTRIGAPQLVMLINLLDPAFRDEKLNRIRSLLSLGAPKSVEVSIDKGYADLKAEIPGVPENLSTIRGAAVEPWISSVTAALAKKSKETLIESGEKPTQRKGPQS
jgi:hypothetical protein